jgi:hypothetical protein
MKRHRKQRLNDLLNKDSVEPVRSNKYKIKSSRYNFKDYIDFLLNENHNYIVNFKEGDVFDDDKYILTEEEHTYQAFPLYINYVNWCNRHDYIPLGVKTFVNKILHNKFDRVKKGAGIYYRFH